MVESENARMYYARFIRKLKQFESVSVFLMYNCVFIKIASQGILESLFEICVKYEMFTDLLCY